MPYNAGGAVEPVAATITLGNWNSSIHRIAAVLGEAPAAFDRLPDGRKRARYFGGPGAVSYLDFTEPGENNGPGDCELVLRAEGVAARIRALDGLGIPVTTDAITGWHRIASKHANGVSVAFAAERPNVPRADESAVLGSLPYVFDIGVDDVDHAQITWSAILGVDGVTPPPEADPTGQLKMHHYVVDGATHAIGLVQLRADAGPTPRATPGNRLKHVLATHGEGLACVGFLFSGLSSLNDHIDSLSADGRSYLLYSSPQQYLMGENNSTHPETTGGVNIVIARHFDDWSGNLHEYAK